MISALKASFGSKAAQDTVRELEVRLGLALKPGRGNREGIVMSILQHVVVGFADNYGVLFRTCKYFSNIYHNIHIFCGGVERMHCKLKAARVTITCVPAVRPSACMCVAVQVVFSTMVLNICGLSIGV